MLRRSLLRRVELPPCDFVPPAHKGLSKAAVAEKRAKFMHPITFTFYQEPIMVAHGHKQYLFDETGHRYLDLFGGVTTVSVGHSHPRINAVIEDQIPRFNHTTQLYLTEPVVEFCELFASKLPKGHDWVVHPVNSGSEANDFAVLTARVVTGNHPVVGLRRGYHGFTENSRGLIAVPGWRHNIPAPPGLHHAVTPHPYHGIFGDNVEKYVEQLDEQICYETGGKIAAFIAERIQGVGGAGALLPGYLKGAYDVVKAHDGLYISDEVQCGYGRLGTHYWGFETEGIVPDIITSAKSVANGYPVGVVAMKREHADKMKGVAYFNTFGGGGVAMRVATETLRIIEDEKLQANCGVVGKRMMDGMNKLAEKHTIIGQVRGMGCMMGMELVTDRTTKAPAKDATIKYMELMKTENILVGKGGPGGNVVRLHPPMCITTADVDAFLAASDKCLGQL